MAKEFAALEDSEKRKRVEEMKKGRSRFLK